MRQAGYLAAAGIYALNNNIERLKEDNDRAKYLEQLLEKHPQIDTVLPVESNILIFKLNNQISADLFIEKLKQNNIHALALDPQTVRFVTHLDFTDEMMEEVVDYFGKGESH